MKSTFRPAKSVIPCFPGLIGYMMLLLLSGCGLAMDNEDRLDRAEEAFAEGEYRAAIIDTKNVLRDEPDNIRGRLLLGRASVEVGDGVSAEKELRKAVELGANVQDFAVELGRALLLQGKFDDVMAEVTPELVADGTDRLAVLRIRGDALIGLQQPEAARELYTDILAVDPDDNLALLGVVNSYIVERNYNQARETLNQVLTFDDSFVPAWLMSGALAMQMRDAQKAASDYKQAVDLAQANGNVAGEMQALSGVADAQMIQNNIDAARPILVRMNEIGPQDTRTLLVAARLAVADEDWTLAQENLQEILRRAPDYRPAQMLLGMVHKERGNLGQAEMYLSAVVAATPGNSNARRLLAEVRLTMNKASEAREALQTVITGPDADVGSLSMAAGASLILGDFDEAEDLLRRAVKADPDNINLKFQLAVAYLRSGNPDSAQELLEGVSSTAGSTDEFQRDKLLVITLLAQGRKTEALEKANALLTRWPDRAEAYSLAGSIEMSIRDYDAARTSFTRASQLAPDNIATIRNLAQLDAVDDDLESARDRYLLILQLQPDDARSMVALAKLAALSEKFDAATEWLVKARDADAMAFTPRLILGSLYVENAKYDDAEVVANEAIQIDPNNAKVHNILGLAHLNRGSFRDAEASFARAAVLAPGEPSYHLNIAKAELRQGDKVAALATLQADTDRSLQHIPSAIALASLKADSGDLDGAMSITRQLLKAHPDEATVHALNAELLAKAGNFPGASAAYDQAIALVNSPRYAIRAYQIRTAGKIMNPIEPLLNFLNERPFHSDMRNYLAGVYQRMDDIDSANAQYELVTSQDSSNFVAANNLAYNYFKAGDVRAEEMARRAYAIQPNNSSVMDTLGWILVNKGALEEGIAMLRSAVRSGTRNAEIHYHLAAGLAAAGEAEEAKIILQELMASTDDFASRQEAERLLTTL